MDRSCQRLALALTLAAAAASCAHASDARIADAVRSHAVVLRSPVDARPIVELVGDASVVMLGEATHGTHEFYALRAQVSRELIETKGFDAVLIEGEWPAAARANRFAQGDGADADAAAALAGFEVFPRWMWRNAVMRDWLAWLRSHNASLRGGAPKAGVYGLDMQNLRASMDAVVDYLRGHDPAAAARARERYACFGPHADKPERYGRAGAFGLAPRCEEPVAEQLDDVEKREPEAGKASGPTRDAWFDAVRNARAVQAAEAYYRAAGNTRASAWNVREAHMAETLDAVRAWIEASRGRPAKVIVWAHNSHVGDARAIPSGGSTGSSSGGSAGPSSGGSTGTSSGPPNDRPTGMPGSEPSGAADGDASRLPSSGSTEPESSLGQIVRMRAARSGEVVLIGLTTHTGSVTAAPGWGQAARRMALQPSLGGSFEHHLHDSGLPQLLAPLRDRPPLRAALSRPLAQRAVGVVYRPESERERHYLAAIVAQQYDAVVHIDATTALQPLP